MTEDNAIELVIQIIDNHMRNASAEAQLAGLTPELFSKAIIFVMVQIFIEMNVNGGMDEVEAKAEVLELVKHRLGWEPDNAVR